MPDDDKTYVEVIDSLAKVEAKHWNACAAPVGETYHPFTSYEFLHALEKSGSAVPDSGWYPQYFIVRGPDGGIDACLPCYLKSHSRGEYVFDHGWAEAFMRAGGRYYPKLQASVPFTPATSRKLLTPPGPGRPRLEAVLAAGAVERCKQLEASSLHLTFLTEPEYGHLGKIGFLQRIDQQFHWQNNGYHTFDDFLNELSSRKRKTIRRERRCALDNDIEIEWLTGSDLTEAHWDDFFNFYMDTGGRKYGTPYLTREFYSLIGETMADRCVLMMCKRQDRYIAGAINFIGGDTLYGRHWGCVEDHKFLHFETCYYQAIDFAIAHKLKFVEAGAQGPHKLARGYQPVTTRSAHYIRDPGLSDAVEDYLTREKQFVEHESAVLARHTPFKHKDPT
jgi:predicted N-acyltransferase